MGVPRLGQAAEDRLRAARAGRQEGEAVTAPDVDAGAPPGAPPEDLDAGGAPRPSLSTWGLALSTAHAPAPPPHAPDGCCAVVIAWLRSFDATWSERLDALMTERAFTPTVAVASLIGWVLDQGLHMATPRTDAFEALVLGVVGEAVCAECGATFTRPYPSAPTCSNACGSAYWQKRPVA